MIVNPTAGRGKAGRMILPVRRRLREATYFLTRARGDGFRAASEAIASGATRLIVMGGDGTLHEVVNAILEAERDDIILGLIPFGTGNDFARGIGLPSNLADLIETALDGRPSAIDVGVINGKDLDRPRYFLVAAGIGLTADTAQFVNDHVRGLTGPAAYVYGLIQTLRHFQSLEISLTIAGETQRLRGSLLSVSNVATTGGGIRIAPSARPDDGLLDVCVVQDMPKLRLLSKLPAAFVGKHESDPLVSTYRVTEIQIDTDPPSALWIDGEVAGSTPAKITIIPGRLTVSLPRQVETGI